MKYYAILDPGETLADCFRVCRNNDAGFEKYNFKENAWKYDEDLWSIYWGSPEVEEITEEQANEVVARVRKCLKSVKNGDSRA